MSAVEMTLAAMNALLAFVAAAMNGRAARRGDPRTRVMFGAIGALALAYSVALIWWLICTPSITVYTSLVRGLALVVWPLVWMLPAAKAVSAHEADVRTLAALRDRATS